MRGNWRSLLWVGIRSLPALAPLAAVAAQPAAARVVRYPAGARAPVTWRVTGPPVLSIGGAGASGPGELAKVIAVVRLTDGRVVVANRASNELRYFAADGRHLVTAGRKGQGPAEFDGMAEVHRSGDSIAVVDRSGRLQVFGPTGTLLRAYPRPTYDDRAVFGWAGLMPDGSGIVRGLETPTDTLADHITAWMSFGLRSPSADGARLMVRYPYLETERMNGAVSAGQRGHTPLWLGPALRTARAGARFCAGYGDTWTVRCVDGAGREVVRTVRDLPAAPVGPGDRGAFEETFRKNFRTMPPAQLDLTLKMFLYARVRGQLGRFVGTAQGDLWVATFAVADEVPRGDGEWPFPTGESRWTVLGSDGTWRADAILPARFALMDAGPGWVAGVLRDEDDVERVVVYRLVP